MKPVLMAAGMLFLFLPSLFGQLPQTSKEVVDSQKQEIDQLNHRIDSLQLLVHDIAQSNCNKPDNNDCIKIVDSLYNLVIDSLNSVVTKRRKKIEAGDTIRSYIVTDFTYNRLTATDISRFLTTEISFSSMSKFASLKLDQDKSRAVFIPFNLDSRNIKKDNYTRLKFAMNLGIDVSMDDQSVFNIVSDRKFNRDFNLFTNINFHFRGSNGYDPIDDSEYRDSIYTPLSQQNDCLRHKQRKACCDCDVDDDEISKQYLEAFYKKENKIAQDYSEWRRFRRWWTLSLTPYGHTSLTGFDTATRNSKDLGYFSPSVGLTYNSLIIDEAQENDIFFNLLYWSAGIKGSIVNTFSEMDAKDMYSLNKWSDSAKTIIDEKGNAYLYNSSNFHRAFLPSANIQVIALKNFTDNFSLGLDLNYQANVLIPIGGKTILKHYLNVGLIIPFKDKDDKPAINIEFFHSNTLYSGQLFDSKDIWGIKFSVPILSKNSSDD